MTVRQELTASDAQTPQSGQIEVAVLIVSYNGRQDLDECLASILRSEDPGIVRRVVVVDNASIDGTAEVARANPHVELLCSTENLGFAGGNNFGWQHICERYPGTRYLYLLNQDTLVASGWLVQLVGYLEQHPEVVVAQSKLLLHPQTDCINTMGNRSHYLGFGYMTEYGQPNDGRFEKARSIDYASGAGVIVRSNFLQTVGLFDNRMFMHLEDAELSWKGRQLGYDIQCVPQSVVYHKYIPNAPYKHYRHLERNRWLLLLIYYKWPTLLFISPALLLMEFGQWLFSLRHGLVWSRLCVYGDLLSPSGFAHIMRRRREIQRRRTVGDRKFVGRFSGTITFSAIDNSLLNWVGNPLLNAYWQIVRRLIFW